ncbi:MAG: carbonic anhydrase family protein [Candidatus Thiodiazotropha sp. (ex Lucinoma borealis)]|nr:carbonic anhydrase family protein [Candidatus Thiodiazotropha sp. (ex Lucinoma borealis)]
MKKYNQIFSRLIFPILVLSTLPAAGVFAATNQHAETGHTSHWGYTDSTDPNKWESLYKEDALYGHGKHQSPLDIWNEVPSDLYPLRIQYQSIPLLVLNNGHTLQADYNTFAREDHHQLFHYSDSLTTPPCSKNINWFVMKTPIEVSDAQITHFEKLIVKKPIHYKQCIGVQC